MADYVVGASDEIARLSLGQDAESPTPPPSPPDLKCPGIVAVDITSKFSVAVDALTPGELVKDGFFTLFDSVAALEIGDPKMDSGCVKAGDEFEELYDVSRPLLPEEVLGIIDQLLCHEMSWHMGYPLSQTLFTSVYVEALLMPNPLSIHEAKFVRRAYDDANQQPMLQVLRAYCLGMLKACGYVNERIKSEHFYEEEDFVTNTYSRSLLSKIPTDVVRQVLTDAEDLLASQRDAIGDEVTSALISRLRLRHVFLAAAECPQHMNDPQRARIPWAEALNLLPKLWSSHRLGKPVEEAFSAKLQRKLASTMPPRPIVELGFEDAFRHLSRLFEDGLEVIGALEYTDSQCLQTFVTAFQAKKPQPLVYVRTLLQTFLFNAMEVLGSMSIRQLLDDDFSIITLPASPLLDRDNDEIEATQDARFVMSQQMELFRQRAAQPFLDILRTACQNRCRVRRTLCHIIRDWENLQVDAEDIDQILQAKTNERPLMQRSAMGNDAVESYSLPLSSWSYLYKLRQMELIVQLGFELEIYQADELGGMYWYLNYLARFRLQHAERIKSFVVHAVEEARSQSGQGYSSVSEQLQRSLAHTRLSLLDAAVTWELSDALCCLYIALHRLDIIKALSRPYSNDELRFALRMKPFASIGFPLPPTFDEFTAGMARPETTTEELLEYGERAAAGAKKGFETLSKLSAKESFSVGSHDRWVAAMKSALRSSIATGIAISCVHKALLKKSTGGDGLKITAEIPTPDNAYHEWWIVPKIVPVV
ncbi:mak10 subunit, natC n(alpha)-terminal acetyltransferase domain-containing protein [Hirsutella rhossiliensis]|uniref:Mak10 subunit, natC n(Alpha)-terminal acetyltransferase domain-containing protein n=1 Tax=Hirsutella rhossiliensis TaxID=111463 RepID=A0A9P8N9B9_9HYPO|nr:mak10 subunit, natC n(alpha)-terminal acetyltransferase domain-containing protein [Hirsutella rhossiliensis]KAH0967002.1 mak10 subunit, natC n(alpha)-terminal acetyltransferase domain-containing protein [Hirsutella rhossiliensis]